jgi:hypothetical protein
MAGHAVALYVPAMYGRIKRLKRVAKFIDQEPKSSL